MEVNESTNHEEAPIQKSSDEPGNQAAALAVAHDSDVAVEPIVVPNTFWSSSNPQAYMGGMASQITHLREQELEDKTDTGRWRALDIAAAPMPFSIRYIGVDRAKEAPNGLVDGLDIEYVPTFIVRRDGREVGRVVESAPGSVEEALLQLLTGQAQGVISGRPELRP